MPEENISRAKYGGKRTATINAVGVDNRSASYKERKLPLAKDLSNQHLVKAPAELDHQQVGL